MESTTKTITGEKNNHGSENNMDVKLTKFLKILFILFVLSTISWLLLPIIPFDNIPFLFILNLVGAFSSLWGGLLIVWFLWEFKTMSKEDVEVITKE
ncbi:MAG TPA: hypothetical protein VMV43_03665 [Candidatus Nanopelagicaceae bacterium]|nr:hypothetical protein [Candidatus Nanopelagicaceae bacterium]